MEKEDCGLIAETNQKSIEAATTTYCDWQSTELFETIEDFVTKSFDKR
jgi:hypothetical protein